MFSEKLNFLMDITKVQNNMLAAAASVDASHISRLRHGNRSLPKNQTFLMPMARFFARQITLDYQKKIVAAAIGKTIEWPEKKNTAAKLIYEWLSESAQTNDTSVDFIIQSFSAPGQKNVEHLPDTLDENTAIKSYYYGIDGKREAVIRFLSSVANEESPQTLLLFSDEEMSWLYEDADFAKKWAALLLAVLMKGNRIKIIHTVSRNLNELLEAVAKWIPIYASDAIEPYYYPKIRDGLFQRTLFIAPKTSAVISASVQQKTDKMLNSYIEDKTAIAALAEDFLNYLQVCKPLMRIFNISNAEKFKKLYLDFSEAEGDFIALRSSLSLATLPQSVIDEFDNSALYELYQNSTKRFFHRVKSFSCTEIIAVPLTGEAAINAAMLGVSDITLTNEQYIAHLKNIILLLKTYPNYHVVLSDSVPPNTVIFAKETVGVLMCKTQMPYSAFAFNEQNMSAAFWDYFTNMKDKAESKNKVIEKLEKLIQNSQ